MALPTVGVRIKTEAQVLPSSALTDFSLLVDLSQLPATQKTDFFGDNDTTDGTRGRIANLSGTELPSDWIDFDSTGQTGLVRIKYTGTLPTSGTVGVYLYPPNTRNTSYARTDTYGRDNAYDSSWWGYWPLHDANDRTVNDRTLSAKGALTFGGAAGESGDSTQFNSATLDSGETTTSFDIDSDSTYIASINCDDITEDRGIIGYNGNQLQFWVDKGSPDRLAGFFNSGVGYGSTTMLAATWYSVAIKRSASGGTDAANTFINGTNEATFSDSYADGVQVLRIGAASTKNMNGRMQHVSVHSVERSDSFVSEESAQTNDNSTFWGNWSTETLGSTSYTLPAESGTITITGEDVILKYNRSLLSESGLLNISGQNVDLTANRILAADGGNINISGQDVNLKYGAGFILNSEPGLINITGQDANLIYAVGYKLNAESGALNITGQDVSFLQDRVIDVESGLFDISGNVVNLIWSGQTGEILTILDFNAVVSVSADYQAIVTKEVNFNGEI